MRKVLVKVKQRNPEIGIYETIEKPGLFHGFFLSSFHDGENNIQHTYAFNENPATGIVKMLDVDDFRFLTEAELKAQNV